MAGEQDQKKDPQNSIPRRAGYQEAEELQNKERGSNQWTSFIRRGYDFERLNHIPFAMCTNKLPLALCRRTAEGFFYFVWRHKAKVSPIYF